MPLYQYKCFECKKEFESIEKLGTEMCYCKCGKLAKRLHGVDVPSPALIEEGVGGVYRPKMKQQVE